MIAKAITLRDLLPDETERIQLGLEGTELSPGPTKALNLPMVGLGDAARYTVMDFASDRPFANPPTVLQIRLKEAEQCGLALSLIQAQEIMQLRSTDGSPIQLRSTIASEDEATKNQFYAFHPSHTILYLHTSLSMQHRIRYSITTKSAIGLLDFQQQPSFTPLLSHPLKLSAPLYLSPEEILGFMEDQEDPWLCDMLKQYLQDPDAWKVAVAVGRWTRLRESSSAQKKRWLNQLLAGKPNKELGQGYQWIRQRTPTESAAIERLAVAEIKLLLELLHELKEELSPEQEDWLQMFEHWLERRDDVEGVYVLLREVGASEQMNILLQALDTAGHSFVVGLPHFVRLSNERLARVHRRDPTAWWALRAASTPPSSQQ